MVVTSALIKEAPESILIPFTMPRHNKKKNTIYEPGKGTLS
jgi:hypothetical protein